MELHGIRFDLQAIAAFCRRHRVARLSLFGSILTDRFSPRSDVDLLVQFAAGTPANLFHIGGMLMELTDLLGREVDLRTAGDLSPYFRDEVVNGARELYAA